MMPACVCDLCSGATYTPRRLFHWDGKSSNLKLGQVIPPDCWQWWLPRLRWIRQWRAMRRNRWGIRDEEILRRGWRCRWRRWAGRRTPARSARSLPSSEPWWPLARRWCLSHCNRRFYTSWYLQSMILPSKYDVCKTSHDRGVKSILRRQASNICICNALQTRYEKKISRQKLQRVLRTWCVQYWI